MKIRTTCWAVAFSCACGPRIPVGTLGSEADGAAGESPTSVLPDGSDYEPHASGGTAGAAPTSAGARDSGKAGAAPTSAGARDSGTAGAAEPGAAGSADTGAAGSPPEPAEVGPYARRSGPFRLVVYSETKGYRHDSAIAAGREMVAEIGAEQGFEVEATEEKDFLSHLDDYEVVFFLHTSGDVFTAEEQANFEDWMITSEGAFVGTHSATDTENGWEFYAEVTGQYHSGHGVAGLPLDLEMEATQLAHPALLGLPNPWSRVDEWLRFNQHAIWSAKPGFQILLHNPTDGHPVAWTRQFAGFRSFYTTLGHDRWAFDDGLKRHLTGGIMWAARRAHLIQ